MGFKIRDKSLFWTTAGWKNNWEPKILNMSRGFNVNQTAYIITRMDHHSYLRMVQSYRNYSRILKQYLYGDVEAINICLLELRAVFRVPFECETPVELIKHGGERRMADQLDRDYELLSYNTHPFQLYMYELRNQYIRANNEEADKIEKGEETLMSLFEQELEKEAREEEARLGQGEKLSLEKITEIYTRLAKSAYSVEGDNWARKEDGEFNDYLEKRRPFMAPNPTGHSH